MLRRLPTTLTFLSCLAICTGCSAGEHPITAAPDDPPAIEEVETTESREPAPESEPALAAATTQPAAPMRAHEPAADFAAAFDEQLLRIASGEPPQAPSSLPADERELLTAIVEALAQFRAAARNNETLLASRTAPLVALSDQLKSQAPLSLPTVALCRSVAQFGVYETFEGARFTAGRETPVIIYCEVDNFVSRLASDSRWETKLTYEAVLYNDSDHAMPLITKKPTAIIDRCRNRRRDFFLADRMTIPDSLPVGKYLLKVTVIDQHANRVAEKSIPLMVAPN